jgi:hypothetical protein
MKKLRILMGNKTIRSTVLLTLWLIFITLIIAFVKTDKVKTLTFEEEINLMNNSTITITYQDKEYVGFIKDNEITLIVGDDDYYTSGKDIYLHDQIVDNVIGIKLTDYTPNNLKETLESYNLESNKTTNQYKSIKTYQKEDKNIVIYTNNKIETIITDKMRIEFKY